MIKVINTWESKSFNHKTHIRNIENSQICCYCLWGENVEIKLANECNTFNDFHFHF